jgi:translation initiation factor eIF-2B subunit gamma
MTVAGSVQAVVMAGGKGSRMTDLTSGKAKCLLPVGNVPLVWYPLFMLQTDGFTEAIVIVAETVRSEVCKIPEKFGLTIKLDVVGIPVNEELGTADSLRKVADKLTGSEVLVVSGDLILEEGTRGLMDMHRINRSAFTAMVTKQSLDLKNLEMPGPKSSKFKKERDLIGLSGDQLCLFTAEADVEEEVEISKKIMKTHPCFTIHTNLLDAHIYVFKKWVIDYIVSDRNISTIKGELLPVLVKKQFSKSKNRVKDDDSNDVTLGRANLLNFVPENKHYHAMEDTTNRYMCHVYKSKEDSVCMRINNMPSYWYGNKVGVYGRVQARANLPIVSASAEVGEKASMSDCRLGFNSVVSNKTTLNNVTLGTGSKVEEKVRISNCVIMDNVTVSTGSNIQDSIICDNCTISEKVTLKASIVGRNQTLVEGSVHENQLLLEKDRRMEV